MTGAGGEEGYGYGYGSSYYYSRAETREAARV